MKLVCGKPKLQTDYGSGDMIISFPVLNESRNDAMRYTAECGDKLTVDVTKWRKARSLDANAYMWVLCTKLAEERSRDGVKVTKDDVYRDHIKELNVFRDYHSLPLPEAKTLQVAWGMLGTGWVTEQVDFSKDGDTVTIRCYYGSSQYSTSQMKRLIDNLIQDCEALGIETKTPDEIANMLSLWEVADEKHSSK